MTAGITVVHLNGSLLVSSYNPIYTVPGVRQQHQKTALLQRTTGFPLHLADMHGFEVNKTINVMQETPWWRDMLQRETRGT